MTEQTEQLELEPEQTTFCTNDEHCQAPVDEHQPTCPVEQQLKEEFGF